MFSRWWCFVGEPKSKAGRSVWAILKADSGASLSEIQKKGDVSRATAVKWRAEFKRSEAEPAQVEQVTGDASPKADSLAAAFPPAAGPEKAEAKREVKKALAEEPQVRNVRLTLFRR